MQSVHDYWRGCPVGSYRFLKTEGLGRSMGVQKFTERVIWRGNFALIETLFPWGKVHPSYPYFYADDITNTSRVPSHGKEAWLGTISFKGILAPSKIPIHEEVGWFVNGRFFPQDGSGNPTLASVPGRPSAVKNIQVNQPVKAYNRRYVSITAPADPTIDSSGIQSKPANFIAPSTPAALLWLTDANAVYTFPNGWYLANATYSALRLSDGTQVPIWEVSEQWLYGQVRSTI